MDFGFAGRKRQLLTGASRGPIGKACALALAQEGVDVTIVAPQRATCWKRTADEIPAIWA
jgi:3-oxoacyl-[acyl-carrier protein] reductase